MLDPVELFPEVPNLYEFPSIHADMLFDEERVRKYSQAIRRTIKKGDVVADIGTGTGLLAFLCVKAGAKRVHAIERSGAMRWAREIAERNGFADRIVFHEVDSRECELGERVDVVVSELIGHIAFEEGMVESLFDAKERLLAPGGRVIPERVKLKVALVEEKEIYAECIDCWGSVAGIDYSILRGEAVKACYVTSLKNGDLVSEPKIFFTVDFGGEKEISLEGNETFSACRSGSVNGIGLWFDASLCPNVALSSGPWARTHWKQCFAPLSEPISVMSGDKVSVDMQMRLRTSNDDSFKFSFEITKEV